MIETIITPHKTLGIFLKELWFSRDILLYFTSRHIKLRYRNITLGIIWVLLQPLILACLVAFSLGRIVKVGNTNYFMFVLLGLIFWQLFLTSFQKISNSLLLNQTFIVRTYIPRLIILLSYLFVGLIDFIFSLIGFLLLALMLKVPLTIQGILMMLIGALLTVSVSFSLGMFFSFLIIKFKDIREVMGFINYLLFFITPVIYPTRIIQKEYHHVLFLNPLVGILEITRGFYFNQSISWGGFLVSIISLLVFLISGFIFFRRNEQNLADII